MQPALGRGSWTLDDVKKGRIILIVGMVLLMTPTAALLVLQLMQGYDAMKPATLIRLVLTALLLVGLYSGSKACRVILTILLSLGIILGILVLLASGFTSLVGMVMSALMTLYVMFLVIMYLPSVDAYIESR